MNTSSDMCAEGVARDIFTGEFWRDTRREGVSSLKGDNLLKVNNLSRAVGIIRRFNPARSEAWNKNQLY